MSNENALKLPSQPKRLFFALWLDKAAVQKINKDIIEYFSPCQGRVLAPNNWHITLAYFGSADANIQACLEQQAAKIISSSFKLQLSICGYWPRPKVAWLAPIEIPHALKHLKQELQRKIQLCGFKKDTREFQPHITLVRKAKNQPAVAVIEPIELKVTAFCLVESKTEADGAYYSVLKRWNLK